MELTNAIRKMVASLDERKHRRREGAFMAEGTKCVLDTLDHFTVRYLIATYEWITENGASVTGLPVIQATARDMERMSHLSAASDVLAVYEIPRQSADLSSLQGTLTVALDTVQDPGNLGTIVRTCDWFGISHILASADTADVYAPKVVQATMGAISRVTVHYCDLPSAISELRQSMPVYGTFLDGDNIYTSHLSPTGIIVMGNEGRGISSGVAPLVTDRLLIPSYPPDVPTSESLNVSIATAITLSEFRRRM